MGNGRTNLRHHDLATRLDPVDRRLPHLAQTVIALDSWQRWANGDSVTLERLHATVEILTDAHGTGHYEQHQALGHVIQTWAEAAGIDLHLVDPQLLTRQHTGIELGL